MGGPGVEPRCGCHTNLRGMDLWDIGVSDGFTGRSGRIGMARRMVAAGGAPRSGAVSGPLEGSMARCHASRGRAMNGEMNQGEREAYSQPRDRIRAEERRRATE